MSNSTTTFSNDTAWKAFKYSVKFVWWCIKALFKVIGFLFIGYKKYKEHKARKAAGITRRITPYSLRHAMPTEALEHGADVKAVAEVMGHADPTMLLRVYQHTRYRLKKKAVNAAPGLKLDGI